jgi:hypothetical protein
MVSSEGWCVMAKSRLLVVVGIVAVVRVLSAQAPAGPAFDVASVKPNTSDMQSGMVAFALVRALRAAAQALEPVADPVAYAIYAVLLPPAWGTRSILLLQQETEVSSRCNSSVPASDPEWEAVENNFRQENSRARVLQPMLPTEIPYRLIPRADILADDARLALKYPGVWERRPESMEYAAVSMVGFNSAKTRAMVYMHLRSMGGIHMMELREGKWLGSRSQGGCFWIA